MVDVPTPSPLPRTIWYMGAKGRVIPGMLDQALERLVGTDGTVLDLFSGTGTVSAFCARRWRVVANDIQRFAWVIARSLIERPPEGPAAFARSIDIDRDLAAAFAANRAALEERYAPALAEERRLLEAYAAAPRGVRTAALGARYRRFLLRPGGLSGFDGVPPDPLYRAAAALLTERSLARYRRDPARLPACLITAHHANVYHGLRQAIDLDSLRAAIESLPRGPRGAERRRVHYLSALIHAASVTTSGTSHFAQPRQLTKDSELLAMARRRRLDILETFRGFSEELAGWVGENDLKRGNRALCKDYGELLRENGSGLELGEEARASVVYMDPPYTADHYSRFYHVLETLARYDYPELERGRDGRPTAGRYPAIGGRFQSRFCRAGTVEAEFRRVIDAAAGSGARLLVSYGSPNGLLLKVYRKRGLRDPVGALAALCRRRYREVETLRRRLLHSGQGDKNLDTEELLFVCEGPRR